jgi:hypothetical protein
MRTPPNFDPLRFARPNRVSDEVRRLLIAEAAYFRAQKRGSVGGDAIDDWLAAEQEVDARLLNQTLRNG